MRRADLGDMCLLLASRPRPQWDPHASLRMPGRGLAALVCRCLCQHWPSPAGILGLGIWVGDQESISLHSGCLLPQQGEGTACLLHSPAFWWKGGKDAHWGHLRTAGMKNPQTVRTRSSRHSSGANACTNISARDMWWKCAEICSKSGPCYCFLWGNLQTFPSSVIWELKRLLYLVKSYMDVLC